MSASVRSSGISGSQPVASRSRSGEPRTSATSCGDDAQAVAHAVDTLTHESFHMRGIVDEGVTECSSLQTMAWTAQRLGVTPEEAQGLARLELETGYPLMPDQYHAQGCADGDRLDLRPGDPSWP